MAGTTHHPQRWRPLRRWFRRRRVTGPDPAGPQEQAVDDTTRIAPVASLQTVLVDDTLIVVDADRGNRFSLNATAGLILAGITRPCTAGELIARLADETGSSPATIRADVIATIARLIDDGLVAPADPSLAPPLDPATDPTVPDEAPPAVPDPPPPGPPHRDDPDRWCYDSGVRNIAGLAIRVRSDLESTRADLHALLAGFAPSPTHPRWQLDVVTHRPDPQTAGPTIRGDATAARAGIHIDGVARVGPLPPDGVPGRIIDAIDGLVTDHAPGLRLHAGAVERDGHVLVVLGRSGAGKSTLTAALVETGWNYVTDEVVLIAPDGHTVTVYARPLELGEASLALLGRPSPGPTGDGNKQPVYPTTLGRVSTGGQVRGLVVLTPPEHGTTPNPGPIGPLEPLAVRDALEQVSSFTFASTFRSPHALRDLSTLCTERPVYRLHREPLAQMVTTIEATFTRPPHRRATGDDPPSP